jgi:hypothetical protein
MQRQGGGGRRADIIAGYFGPFLHASWDLFIFQLFLIRNVIASSIPSINIDAVILVILKPPLGPLSMRLLLGLPIVFRNGDGISTRSNNFAAMVFHEGE